MTTAGRRLALAACGALTASAGCLGKPKDPPPPAPEDRFELGTGKLLVTCRQDDRVAILDPARLGAGASAIERSIQVGFDPYADDQPHEALLGPDAFGEGGLSWFVTVQVGPRSWGTPPEPTDGGHCDVTTSPHCAHMGGAVPGGVEKYRVRDNAFDGRAQVGFGSAQLVITPDGKKMYVTAFDTAKSKCGRVAVINPRTMTVIRVLDDLPRGPHGLAITPDGSLVVVATSWDRVVLIPTADEDAAVTIPVGSSPGIEPCADINREVGAAPRYSPNLVAVSPDGTRAYVTLAGSVVAVDLAARAMLPGFEVRTGRSPQQPVVSPDNTKLVVSSSGDNTLDVIDVASQERTSASIARAASAKGPFGLALSPDGRTAYVAADCYQSISGICLTPRQGAILEFDLAESPPAFRSKVPVCDGVTHVTFAAPPR